MGRIFFTPGPTQAHPKLKQFIGEALDHDICSISHRGKQYEEIHANAVNSLKTLLKIPKESHVFFMGSATEAMERIVENCVERKSVHLVNGEFSNRLFMAAVELKKKAEKIEVAAGNGFDSENLEIAEDAELVCITQNETSTGVSIPESEIHDLKAKHPDKLFAIDIVSSVPYCNIDFSLVDCAFFSVQKCFGMPSGLGVLVANRKMIEKSTQMQSNGINIGTYHSFPSLAKSAEKSQTPETPNVLAIYLLGRISDDMNQTGLRKIRKLTEQKSALVYDACNKNGYSPFVKEPKFRSRTTIAIEVANGSSSVIQKLKENGLIVGSGYKEFKDRHIRIANFPMHSIEDVKKLLELL